MSEDLAGLREHWAITRGEGRWIVGRLGDCYECGDSFTVLAHGDTVAEAIASAADEEDRQEREDEVRHADYERRKAAGQLTSTERLVEQLNAYTMRTFGPKLIEAIETPSKIAVRTWDYKA